MGIILAILVGLFGDKAFKTKLYAGGYTLSQSFWGFGVVGGLAVLMIAGLYVSNVAASDDSSGGGWTLMAIRATAVPIALYAFVTFVGIWRASQHSAMWVKFVSRYFSLFLLSTAGACLLYFWTNFIIVAIVYGLKVYFQRKRATENTSVTSGQA